MISTPFRGGLGGSFYTDGYLNASGRSGNFPTLEDHSVGFRVVEVPEPSMMALLALGVGIMRRRRA